MKAFVKSLFGTVILASALVTLSQAQANTPFSVGRLLKEPEANAKTDTTKTLTGLSCTWTCADSATKAAEFGVTGPTAQNSLVAYTGELSNCGTPDKAVNANFKGCCRPQPYNDWGVVANGVVNGQKVRAVLPCGGR